MKNGICLLLSVAVCVLAACQKTEGDVTAGRVTVSLSATVESSRTTVSDGDVVKSEWKEGDQIDLFLANDGATWTTADATLQYDAATAKFTGTVPTGTYNAVYLIYPAGLPIQSTGNRVLFNPGTGLTQSAAAPTAHIAECMWGTITDVTFGGSEVLNVAMQRKSSVLKISITNDGSKPSVGLTVTEVPFVESPLVFKMTLAGPTMYSSYVDIVSGTTTNATSVSSRVINLSGYSKFSEIAAVYIPLARDLAAAAGKTVAFTLSYKESSMRSIYEWRWSKAGVNFADNRWIILPVKTSECAYTDGGAIETPFVPVG